MSEGYRIERDSMGEMQVLADALWGASTQRAVENFPVSGRPLPPALIHALGHVKAACAQANRDLGKLPADVADAIIAAANEVAEGKHDAHFPVDVYQTGSGTSSNMNANEVIANLATSRLRLSSANSPNLPNAPGVHPNDHVNMGQSSNDVFPTAMHVAAALAVKQSLVPALKRLAMDLRGKAADWDDIVKIGRTHLMDATPIRVGQVFAGYSSQASSMIDRLQKALANIQELAIGGTAVGTGINTHPEFAPRVAWLLSQQLKYRHFREAHEHVSSQAAKDGLVSVHGELKTIAVSLSKIANDIRLLGSGPRCGIGELILPAIQPGSSIMPGKVNPVICESVIQVCCRVIGNDAVITTAGLGGVGSIFELNTAMPVIADAMLESIHLLANVTNVFVDKCLAGLQVNRERCQQLLEQSLMMVTPLAAHPDIGYDQAAKIAKQAFEQNKTIRQVVLEQGLLDEATLDDLLDPRRMTEPQP
jgi:fumarate hydratase, class II